MPYQHILVAIDLTEECHPVVARAQALASTSNAKLSLVHIIEPMAMALVATCRWTFRCCNNSSSTRHASA